MTGLDQSLQFSGIPRYLQSINFPKGEEIHEYTQNEEIYFPLTRADLENLNDKRRELKLRNFSDKYASLLQQNIDRDQEFIHRLGKNVSFLLISEMVDNIYEHSNASIAFIFSQYWPRNNSCEICLADNGIGIFQSLLNAGRNVENEDDAIKKVINEYLSSKDEFGSSKRGTGIKNTIKVLSNNELNGYFCVISDNTGYYIDNQRDLFLNLQNTFLSGTMIDMGFQKPATNFDIYEYIR